MEHSVLGASSAYRWMNCPGSIRLSKDIPKQFSSRFAAEGTAAHQVGEWALKKDWNANAYLDVSVKVEDQDFVVDEEMAEAVQVYLDAVRAELNRAKGLELKIENQFNLDYLHPGLWGTNDACVIQPFGRLTVFDYKHGKGYPVEVEKNPQLMYYALGALQNMVDCDTVRIVIVQPRARHRDGPIRSWECTPEYLENWGKNELLPAAIATEDPGAKVEASDDWCRFCPILGSCEAVAKRNMALAEVAFSPVNLTANDLPAVELLSDKQVGFLIRNETFLKAWLAEVAKTGYFRATHGREIVGCKLVRSKSNRKWIDDEFAEKCLVQIVGDAAYSPRKLVSPSAAEKVLQSFGKKPAARDALIAHLYEKPDGGTVIVPIEDRREAVTSETAFSAVEIDI